jgi:hypothetical protein
MVSGEGRPASDVEETTMRYLALVGADEATAPDPGSPEYNATMGGYARFGEDNAAAIVAGAPLQRSHTAATIRHTDDPPLVTDGPYAESTEAIGGYYVLDAETLDDAIEMARQIPAAEHAWVAVRPTVGWWDYADEAPPAPETSLFMAVMYGKETPGSVPGTPEWDEAAAAHGRFVEAAKARGAVAAGGALHPVDTTTTVRVRNGEVLVTDGPFSESAEVTGGLYVLCAADREAAVALATGIPAPAGGAVEVRPLHVP